MRVISALVVFLASFACATGEVFACDVAEGGFLPENKLNIPAVGRGQEHLAFGVQERDFNEVLSRIEKIYAPLVAARGGRFQIDRRWGDGTVNAYADRSGPFWIIKMFGGLARHPAITNDGFALIACHELGHHLGGAPRYRAQWASNEGQADYFATLKCLRRVWQSDDNPSIVSGMNIPQAVRGECEKSFSSTQEIAICERTSMAGLSAANLSKALDGSREIAFTTPDPNVVPATLDSHPRAQCRLDTYFSGSICQVSYEQDTGDVDPTVGTCSTEKGATFGTRPFCWYRPI